MGDPKLKTLSMARRELEELYLGIPDESVNFTFEHLAVATSRHRQHVVPSSSAENRRHAVDPDSEEENKSKLDKLSSLNKLPSLDFIKAMQASRPNHYHHHQHSSHVGHDDSVDSPTMNYVRRHHHIDEDDDNSLCQDHRLHQSNLRGRNRDNPNRRHHYMNGGNGNSNHHDHHYMNSSNGADHHRLHRHQMTPPTRVGYSSASGFKHGVESMTNFDDLSAINMASNVMNHRRRPGIPHSNICTLCTTYIYVFRHRCLACGRVYCRSCVGIGMGEMSEGRKCVECLGKRFSQRYIQRAGKVGCWSRYPAKVKQAELNWADKGPRGSRDERGYGTSVVTPTRSRSPVTATKGKHSVTYNHSNPPSFVTSSSFSPYSPSRHTPPPPPPPF